MQITDKITITNEDNTDFYKNLDLTDIIYFNEEIGEFLTEKWKDIIGYEGCYQISNLGRLKSLSRFVNSTGGKRLLKSRIIKLHKDGGGYFFGSPRKNGIPKPYSIHTLVAKAFIPNPENKREVNHKKGIKSDNMFWALEWNTSSENKKHAYNIGLKNANGSKNGFSKLTEKEVLEIRSLVGLHVNEISKIYNTNPSNIRNIIARRRWVHI